jgi:hypothetical protein
LKDFKDTPGRFEEGKVINLILILNLKLIINYYIYFIASSK